MIKQEGKLGKFPLFHPSDHLIQRSISLVMIMRYHLFQLLVLLLVTTAKSTTTRSSILRTAAANQKANKKASLHAEFDEWLKTKSIDSSKKNVDFNTNKMDATTLLEVNVDGQTSSQSSGISDLAHTISDIKEVNTFFQDCDVAKWDPEQIAANKTAAADNATAQKAAAHKIAAQAAGDDDDPKEAHQCRHPSKAG